MIRNFTDFQMHVFEKGKIDCIDIVKLLGDYHDKELPESLRDRLNGHIQECAICAELYASYSFVCDLARQLQPAPMPSAAKKRLRHALRTNLGLDCSLER